MSDTLEEKLARRGLGAALIERVGRLNPKPVEASKVDAV
jgi:hypothetical protein